MTDFTNIIGTKKRPLRSAFIAIKLAISYQSQLQSYKERCSHQQQEQRHS